MKRALLIVAATWVAIVALQAHGSSQVSSALPGGPLSGLTPREFSEFRLGLDDFTEVETAEEGLGPAFNGTSCAVCHSVPTIGGGGVILELRAGYRDGAGVARGLNDAGDTLIHLLSTPTHHCQPLIPDDVDVIARRAPIPLFGVGLVEAIPDDTLIDLADPDDRNRDGISGRAAIIEDIATGTRRVGRFGWKAQHATLIAFGADAYRNEMGITNDLFPVESAFGIPEARMRSCDPFPDPEDLRDPSTGRRGIDNFASFMTLLAPVTRGGGDVGTREGEQIFMATGCAACHVPVLTTGPSANPLFDRRPVPLFSDLLLHDIGTGDGIAQAAAGANEFRTPALWGLRFRRPLLHDGSAATITEAIERHAGEAARARRGFAQMPAADRALLLMFLRSL